MNDRFKYRIWWKSRQKYIDDRMLVTPTGRKLWSGMTIPVLPSEDDDFVVDFCTGLSDKNGNLIYEGDILLLRNNKFEVGNNNITVFFKCLTDEYTHIDPMDFDYDESEIVGNIHEQAEQKE